VAPAAPWYLNRELSWLDFNARVLALAESSHLPLFDRLRFASIFSSNLDEFFQVRVAGLRDQVAAGVTAMSPDGRLPAAQLAAVRRRVVELVARQERCVREGLLPGLARAGISVIGWDELDPDERKRLGVEFDSRIFPVLTPLGIDRAHPFPYISNLSLNLLVVLGGRGEERARYARVKLPSLLPRFVALSGDRLVPLEDVVTAHLDLLFPGMVVRSVHPFRLTRNADLTFEEEESADDLLAAVELGLRRRRFKKPVRLEIAKDTPDDVRRLLEEELELGPDDVYELDGPLGLGDLAQLAERDRPDLERRPLRPVAGFAASGDPAEVFGAIRERDILVHHPYHSFGTTVEAFVATAARDPDVQALKMTLYRTSGDSPIVESLIGAAERGKQVAVIIELTARFDEQANVEWARRLEEAGVHVVYGVEGFKTHAKAILVVRGEADGPRRYCHVGTGNYNPRTARTYEDLGLFTADPAIGDDLARLFNMLTGFGPEPRFARLLVAPQTLRHALAELIAGEAAHGPSGRIVVKLNSLVDPALIDALYAASRAGARIDLLVRGICCLVPQVPDRSENVRVRSLVGRFLEHSRVFHFANGGGLGVPAWFIGSADLMPRNLDRRVEALVPVADPRLCEELDEIIDVYLTDEALTWELGPDGAWTRRSPTGDGADAHVRFAARARGLGE
jgi:polyphosphate kinase